MEKKIVNVNCSFCGKQIECPENMLNSEKHACVECFLTLKEKGTKQDWGKIHVDIPPEKIGEIMPEVMSDILLENVFAGVWDENKNEFRQKSKKEIAELMFVLGVESAINMIRNTEDELEENGKEAT